MVTGFVTGAFAPENKCVAIDGAPTKGRAQMNKRFLSLGMIIPFIAAGALATAPAASAHDKDDDTSVECSLKAEIDGDDIKVKLTVESEGDQGKKFRVKIWQDDDRILKTTKWDKDGGFSLRKTVDEDDGDKFKAYVKNVKTGDDDTCKVTAS